MTAARLPYDELAFYTLSHPNPAFIHQHVVDAYTAQNADERTKPIAVTFALVGLYLLVDKNFTGKQVQQAHMRLAKRRKTWPKYPIPKHRGSITVADVVSALPGEERDAMIRTWCESVWKAWRSSHNQIAKLVETELNFVA